MVHTAPRLLFSSTRTKHLCSDRLCLIAFCVEVGEGWKAQRMIEKRMRGKGDREMKRYGEEG